MLLTPDQPLAGILAPLFALRRENDLGIGDVGALRDLVDWAAEQGFGVVQLLPINETGNDHSPYNAVSSVALEPTTLELSPETIPDLSEADFAEVTGGFDLDLLRAGPVDYPQVRSLKLRLLDRAFGHFSAHGWKQNDRRARKFRTFCKAENAWLDDYALFRVLMDENGGTERWDIWPQDRQNAATARHWLAAQRPAVRRHFEIQIRGAKYRQWLVWQQWREAKAYADTRGVALMGDIPFGVSYYSADTWGTPEIFDLKWSGGCPPERILEVDEFTKKWGQNWGIPLYRWDVLRARNFDWWRQRVRKVRDVFHLFRIDHVLGVFRIYGFPWRPQFNADFLPLTPDEAAARTDGELPHFVAHADDSPEHQAANCAQGEEILEVLIEECGQWRLIGEDLGEVPPYVRPCLQRLEIAGFKIPQWEDEPSGAMIDGSKYERLSLVTYATHDHEPLLAMWEGWMSAIRAAEHGGPETWPARDRAWQQCRRFARYAGFDVPELAPWTDDIHERLLGAILRSNSWLCVFMITDLFATSQRFNIPGAVSESNWSQRLEQPVGQWKDDPKRRAKLARIRKILAETGRLLRPGDAVAPG
jgi:4-alpha-glucanotransferase